MDSLLFINNADVPASGGATFARHDPVTDAVATRAAAANVADAIAAADAAADAFGPWSATGPTERRRLLLKAADLMEARTKDFAAVMAGEVGASEGWAGFNVHLAAGIIREAASMTTQIQGETIPTDRPGTLSMTIRQPVGVVLSIAPWNGPVILATRAIAYPLACGNTVVLKASELSPGTHLLIAQVFREAGIPKGVLNVITHAAKDANDIVAALIAHRAVRRINFTGSSRVGRIIAETAGRHLKPVLLELGGKSPRVVLDDGDIDEAVNAAVCGAFVFQVQVSMSTERIVVDEAVADEFVAKFAARAAALPVGDPRKGACVIGPLVTPDASRRLAQLIADSVSAGATVATGGKVDGPFMTATVLDHVTPGMRIYDEETFGPVTCVVRARGVEDAIRLANDTEYGLSGAVFGRNVNRALAVALRIQSGSCHVNGPTVQDEAQIPFGGTKASGYGRFGGRAVIEEFTELRWITIESTPQHYPF